MSTRGLGRDQIHDTAWHESYPHPLMSCMMPILAILVIIGAGMLGLKVWQLTLPPETRVPSVEGLQLDQAISDLRNAGLAVEVMKDRAYNEEIPAGAVISSAPDAGRRIKQGRLVRVLVSAGSVYTTVPDVRELSQAVAHERISQAGLLVSTEDYQFHSAIPFDRVISISPKQGARVKRLSPVSLILSKGPKPTEETNVPESRSTVVTVDIPTTFTQPDNLRIDVTDDSGTRTVYEESHNPGDHIVETVTGSGTLEIQVYFGEVKLLTRTF